MELLMEQKQNTFEEQQKLKKFRSAKELAYLSLFVALTISVQWALTALPGVELVTVLFVSYAFAFGKGRGMVASTAFSLLRQLVFGFYPNVLILYLVYYNALAFTFGVLGEKMNATGKCLAVLTVIACVGTACFSMLDNLLTPIWYGYSARETWLYFYYSLPFMIPQIICTAVTVSVLFLPLLKVFLNAKRSLRR